MIFHAAHAHYPYLDTRDCSTENCLERRHFHFVLSSTERGPAEFAMVDIYPPCFFSLIPSNTNAYVITQIQGCTSRSNSWIPEIEICKSDTGGCGYITTLIPTDDKVKLLAIRCHTCLVRSRKRARAEAVQIVYAICIHSTIVGYIRNCSVMQVAGSATDEIDIRTGRNGKALCSTSLNTYYICWSGSGGVCGE